MKQCLDIEQMQHLQELGLELKKDTILVWARFMLGKTQISDWEIAYNHSAITENSQIIPAYTLQDVLDALPLQIEIPLHPERGKYELRIKRFIFDKRRVMHAVLYEKDDYIDWFVMHSYETLIDAAYEMLVWCIENGYVETKKSKQGNDMRHVQRERMV